MYYISFNHRLSSTFTLNLRYVSVNWQRDYGFDNYAVLLPKLELPVMQKVGLF